MVNDNGTHLDIVTLVVVTTLPKQAMSDDTMDV